MLMIRYLRNRDTFSSDIRKIEDPEGVMWRDQSTPFLLSLQKKDLAANPSTHILTVKFRERARMTKTRYIVIRFLVVLMLIPTFLACTSSPKPGGTMRK